MARSGLGELEVEPGPLSTLSTLSTLSVLSVVTLSVVVDVDSVMALPAFALTLEEEEGTDGDANADANAEVDANVDVNAEVDAV